MAILSNMDSEAAIFPNMDSEVVIRIGSECLHGMDSQSAVPRKYGYRIGSMPLLTWI